MTYFRQWKRSGKGNMKGTFDMNWTTIKGVIFDLDGTLVDSMWMWKAIDIEYLGKRNLQCPEDLQKMIEGMSFTETAAYFKERFNLPDSLEEIKAEWVLMSLDKYKHQVPLKPGAGRFLQFLKDRNIPMGIATSNGSAMVDGVLESLKIRPFFHTVVTACQVQAGKPAPDIYLYVAKELGVRPQDCLVFEDVPAGIQAGKAAGMKVVAMADEFSCHMEADKRRLADFWADDFDQVMEMFD